MKKGLTVLLICAAAAAAFAGENAGTEDAGGMPTNLGINLGAGITLNNVLNEDETIAGVRRDVLFNKSLGGLRLRGHLSDKIMYHKQMDMRVTHFEEEIGYRFSITDTAGLAVFVKNINEITGAPDMPPGLSAVSGMAEPGVKIDGGFSWGGLQIHAGIPVIYRQSMQPPDVEPAAGFHTELIWQSNFGLGLSAGANIAFPPASQKTLFANEKPFERTEFRISFMAGSMYADIYFYSTIDFEKISICPTLTYFSGPFSVWFSLDFGTVYYQDFAICPTAGVTYSL